MVFRNMTTQAVVDYIKEKYDAKPEFLWAKAPTNAAFRHNKTNKWFGALILELSKDKLGLENTDRVDVINLKCDPFFVSMVVDNKSLFRGYHMNKQNWITVLLDGSVLLDRIKDMIDMSYSLIETESKGKK